MATRKSSTRRGHAALTTQLSELSMAAPQVVAHRLSRMALSGPVLSKRDQKEFTGMVNEKQVAFFTSWWAMGMEVYRLQWEFAQAGMKAMLANGGVMTFGSLFPTSSQWQHAATRIATQGLKPVHGKAVANARRLNRSKR